jgi:RNA polymerase sigma factor (TIGR02999 family)
MTQDPTDDAKPVAITQLLDRWRAGDASAHEALVAAVYPTLRAISQRHLRAGAAITLSATELVHEGYLRLVGREDAQYANRDHFYAVASLVIRNVLVDAWRERAALKRGGEFERITLSALDDWPATEPGGLDVVDMDRLLDRLARVDERAAKLVELRFFAGLSIDEAARVTGRSATTAKRDWQFARAWMRAQLEAGA